MKRLTVGLPRENKSSSAPGEANARKSFRINGLRLEPCAPRRGDFFGVGYTDPSLHSGAGGLAAVGGRFWALFRSIGAVSIWDLSLTRPQVL